VTNAKIGAKKDFHRKETLPNGFFSRHFQSFNSTYSPTDYNNEKWNVLDKKVGHQTQFTPY
jgi:hypothetical protein